MGGRFGDRQSNDKKTHRSQRKRLSEVHSLNCPSKHLLAGVKDIAFTREHSPNRAGLLSHLLAQHGENGEPLLLIFEVSAYLSTMYRLSVEYLSPTYCLPIACLLPIYRLSITYLFWFMQQTKYVTWLVE